MSLHKFKLTVSGLVDTGMGQNRRVEVTQIKLIQKHTMVSTVMQIVQAR